MRAVMIVPTGLGCEIGGHAGDGCAAARLLAGAVDELIVHPNVVNGSDLCEMTENMLYVEGSILDDFLRGEVGLKRVRANRLLLVVNAPVQPSTVNSVSAARVQLGLECSVLGLETPLTLRGWVDPGGAATGEVRGVKELYEQVQASGVTFDALAVQTVVTVEKEEALKYMRNGGVNPWGAVEAMASRKLAQIFGKPVAHAPFDSGLFDDFNEEVDPRMAAETVSVSYLHCILKGLHRSPRFIAPHRADLTVEDIDALVSPYGCEGPPHAACRRAGIPIIYVTENSCCFTHMPASGVIVDNYHEAVGVLVGWKQGVSWGAVRRPLDWTEVRG